MGRRLERERGNDTYNNQRERKKNECHAHQHNCSLEAILRTSKQTRDRNNNSLVLGKLSPMNKTQNGTRGNFPGI